MNCCTSSARSRSEPLTRARATTGTRATAPSTSWRRSIAAVSSTRRPSTSTATTTTRTAGRGSTSRTPAGSWTRSAQVQLSLGVSGSGIVSSGDNHQECEASCTSEWNAGTSLELVAEATARLRVRLVDRRVRGEDGLVLRHRPRRDDGGRRRLPAAPSARAPDHRARNGRELRRDLLPVVLDAAGRGDTGRAPREGREGLAVRPLERRLPRHSPRLHPPARHRRGKGRGRVRPARVTEPGLAALCPRWARCAC